MNFVPVLDHKRYVNLLSSMLYMGLHHGGKNGVDGAAALDAGIQTAWLQPLNQPRRR